MREDLFQIFSFTAATVISLSNIHSHVVDYLALIIAFGFLARYFLAPLFPGARIRVLQKALEEAESILRLALSESLRDRLPHFVLQVELDLLYAKRFASGLQSDLLRAKKVSWKEWLAFLRGISLKAVRCQWQVKELQIALSLALEAERQRRYNESIRDKQAAISSLISMGPISDQRTAIQATGRTSTRTGYPPM
ncbi:hypothetical protein B0H17DRAFT_1128059 [Mycena rosella]|uniref:Uncharacterized protein n=1 Tax=Mycena rosella TaxID=1033263 RepID=A0AAD7DX26_MYCRO|nr:hypothetical protein B0H17DRAFT_1128059 [Mycena rosella]